MPFSLHVERVDGSQGDLISSDLSESLKVFHEIPWASEISQWELVPEEQRENCRPLFQILDDSGHILHITAYSEHLIAVAYNFPTQASAFGLSLEEDEGYIGTDQFPRGELIKLFECFYTSDTQAMLSLLKRFPAVTRSTD